MPSIQQFIQRKSANLKALIRYPGILKKLKDKQLFFFFPFWHIGGAERVHVDILKEFSEYNTICFITEDSVSDRFKNDFLRYSETVELGRWSTKAAFRPLMLKKIAEAINKTKNAVVFGCNSPFFYYLTPYLDQHVKVIDLIHAFSAGTVGCEWYSLPYVHRINKRVILGNKTRNDFKDLYASQNIPPHYLDRFIVIPNKVDLPESLPDKDFKGRLKVLFVGRNSAEKRVGLFLRIAQLCLQNGLPLDFLMAGDFNNLTAKVSANTKIIGEIHDKQELNRLYSQAHILLITSDREGFPMVILEGMSYGVVPISTDVGEIPAYISPEKKNGFLVENKGDEEQIASAFVKNLAFLVNNLGLLNECSKTAAEFVSIHFNPACFSKAYRQLILNE